MDIVGQCPTIVDTFPVRPGRHKMILRGPTRTARVAVNSAVPADKSRACVGPHTVPHTAAVHTTSEPLSHAVPRLGPASARGAGALWARSGRRRAPTPRPRRRRRRTRRRLRRRGAAWPRRPAAHNVVLLGIASFAHVRRVFAVRSLVSEAPLLSHPTNERSMRELN